MDYITIATIGMGVLIAKKIFNSPKNMYGVDALSYYETVQAYYNKVKKYNNSQLKDVTILAMIYQESAGDPRAVGDGGKSLGLMQLQEGAWIDSGISLMGASYNKENAFNPDLNISAGIGYINFIDRKLDKDDDAIIMSYNIGIGNYTKNKKLDVGSQYLQGVRKHEKELKNHILGY